MRKAEYERRSWSSSDEEDSDQGQRPQDDKRDANEK